MHAKTTKTAIFDSSVWVAYYNSKDLHHQRARQIVGSCLKKKNQIIVPLIVIIETINVLAREGFNQTIVNEVFNKLLKDNEKQNTMIADLARRLVCKIRLKSNDLIILIETLMQIPDQFETFDKKLKITYEHLILGKND